MVYKSKSSKTLLPLLSITALLLSYAVVSYPTRNYLASKTSGAVLSKSDEVEETEIKQENKQEDKQKSEVKEKTSVIEIKSENRTIEKSGSNKDTREDAKKNTNSGKKVEVKVREITQTKEQPKQSPLSENQDNKKAEDNKVKELSREKRFEVETEGITAESENKVSVNTKENQLEVQTDDGKNVEVKLLPNQAIENLSKSKDVEVVGEVKLVENEGKVEYKASVVEKKKLFGLFNVTVNSEYTISSEDGSVKENQSSTLSKILNFFSR